MSTTSVLGVTPNKRPVVLLELRNAFGWSPSIWQRLLGPDWSIVRTYSPADDPLEGLWHRINSLPDWQQVALALTFDTGVIPFTMYDRAADLLDEFDRRLPAPDGHANHVPAVAKLLRSQPEAPYVGIWGTSVSENPFDPWDREADDFASGLPESDLYLPPCLAVDA